MRKECHARVLGRILASMEANDIRLLQLHIDCANDKSSVEVARRTLNALRLVRPKWFVEGSELPIVRSDLFAELGQPSNAAVLNA